jgi:hypothetical protein
MRLCGGATRSDCRARAPAGDGRRDAPDYRERRVTSRTDGARSEGDATHNVTIKADGRDVKYEGVLVGAILARAGATLGRDMTGANVSTYVVATASDGYRALFSLAELDPEFTGSEIIVADTVDGKPLFDYQGPFRIVAPRDTRGARGVRMLQKLEVVRLPK